MSTPTKCLNSTSFLCSFSVPPRVKPRPEDGNIVVKKGTEVTLECSASGNPVPEIVWNREVKISFYFACSFLLNFFFLFLLFVICFHTYHYIDIEVTYDKIKTPWIRNGILSPKLFRPTVRKTCSSDREKPLKFEAEGREFAKFLRSLKLKRCKKQ